MSLHLRPTAVVLFHEHGSNEQQQHIPSLLPLLPAAMSACNGALH